MYPVTFPQSPMMGAPAWRPAPAPPKPAAPAPRMGQVSTISQSAETVLTFIVSVGAMTGGVATALMVGSQGEKGKPGWKYAGWTVAGLGALSFLSTIGRIQAPVRNTAAR